MLLHNIGNYIQERYTFLKSVEGERLYVYVDTEGIPTIGIGINLQAHGALILQALGFDVAGTQLTGAALIAEQAYIARFIGVGGLFNQSYSPNNTISNQALAAFNAVLQERASDPAYSSFQRVTNFQLASVNVSEDLFISMMDGYTNPVSDIFVPGYEATLDKWLNVTGVGTAQPGLFAHDSTERLALLSLAFNSRQFKTDQANTPWNDTGLPKLLGKGLTTALLNDNRAEAWYEIRYGSNSAGGHATRRYREANLFGLYDYGSYAGSITPEEAKEVMRMYTIHKTDIYDYERKYSPPLSQNVLSIDNEILLAKNYLIDNFSQGRTIDGEVIVGKGLSTYEYKDKGNYKDNLLGTANNDLIFGEKGDDSIVAGGGDDVVYGGEGNDFIAGEIGGDTLYGEAGNDTLIGGTGNDILEGGSGNDDYIFQSGDGSDKINDNQGTNRIIWEDSNGNLHVEKTFYKTADAQWKSADGTTEVNQNSPYKMVFQDGTTVELGESINSFDINLKDVPENPALLIV